MCVVNTDERKKKRERERYEKGKKSIKLVHRNCSKFARFTWIAFAFPRFEMMTMMMILCCVCVCPWEIDSIENEIVWSSRRVGAVAATAVAIIDSMVLDDFIQKPFIAILSLSLFGDLDRLSVFSFTQHSTHWYSLSRARARARSALDLNLQSRNFNHILNCNYKFCELKSTTSCLDRDKLCGIVRWQLGCCHNRGRKERRWEWGLCFDAT